MGNRVGYMESFDLFKPASNLLQNSEGWDVLSECMQQTKDQTKPEMSKTKQMIKQHKYLAEK